MAVRMMTTDLSQPNTEIVENYPGCETWRVSHHWDCPHKNNADYIRSRGPNCPDYCQNYNPLYMQTTYQGCVLDTYERNGRDDSDFYAIVWDEPNQTILHIEYASTRGWTYPNGATVDATPEVQAKAQEYLRKTAFDRWQDDNRRQAKMPYKGRKVKVIAGRKLQHGTVGEVFWFGQDSFKKSRYNNPMASALGMDKFRTHNKRVGITWTDESGVVHKEFLGADQVEVANPNQYLQDVVQAKTRIYETTHSYRCTI